MTSFSSKQYFSLFDESASKIQTQTEIPADFNRLARLEGVPNLKALYAELNDPFKKLPKLRSKNSSATFRKWLSETGSSKNDADITKEYLDSITESKGFFETRKGKLTKSVVMTVIGTGIGALIGGGPGALVGATARKTLEIGADWGLDLVDEFLFSGLTRGGHPGCSLMALANYGSRINPQKCRLRQNEFWISAKSPYHLLRGDYTPEVAKGSSISWLTVVN